MKNLSPEVKSEYEFSLDQFSPISEIKDGILSERDVFNAHFVLSDFFLATGESVRFGILNFNLLSSAVARQSVGFGGKIKWNDPYTKVSTLSFGLDKNHAFNDGNKRTALLCMLMALHRVKRRMKCKKKDLEVLLVRIAANEMEKYNDFNKFKKNYGEDAIVEYMANFLRKNSEKIDNTFRTMTYEEFNRKLGVYDVELRNPSGSYIDVYQKEEIEIKTGRNFLGLNMSKVGIYKKERVKEYVRKLQIGFPGWKRQINIKAVKSVLKATKLTSENGVDMKTFYDGAEPEYKLIDEYFDVLKRLKDE